MNRFSKSKKRYAFVMAIMLVWTCIGTIPVMGKKKDKTGFSKEEMVYVITDGDGNKRENKKTIVENYIKNPQGKKIVKDESILDPITPLSGIDHYDKKGNNIRWNTRKTDICYRGETDKQIPLKLHVEYYLNGEKLSAAEIKNKSGEFKIRISFDVHDRELIRKNTFGVVGVGFKSANFSDLEGENIKVLEKGKNKFAVGYMSIGRSNISALKEVANSIEIRGETKNFKPVEGYAAAGTMGGIFKKDGIKKTISKELNNIACDSSITDVSNIARTMVESASREQILLKSLRINDKTPNMKNAERLLRAISNKSASMQKFPKRIAEYMQRELIPMTQSSVGQFHEANKAFGKIATSNQGENATGSEFVNSMTALKTAGMEAELNAVKADFKSHYGVDVATIGGAQIQQAFVAMKEISEGLATIGAEYGAKADIIHKQNMGINEALYQMTHGMQKAEAGMAAMGMGYKKIATVEGLLHVGCTAYRKGAFFLGKKYAVFLEGIKKYDRGTVKFNSAAHRLSQGGDKLAEGTSLLYSKAYADFGAKMRMMVFEKLSALKDKEEERGEGFSGNRKNTLIDTKYVFKFS